MELWLFLPPLSPLTQRGAWSSQQFLQTCSNQNAWHILRLLCAVCSQAACSFWSSDLAFMICTGTYQSKYSPCQSAGPVQWQNPRENIFIPAFATNLPKPRRVCDFSHSFGLPLPFRASCSPCHANTCWCRLFLWHLIAPLCCWSLFSQRAAGGALCAG